MISFVKYQALGNDFILIDCIEDAPPKNGPFLARCLCDRKHGIGADGLLLLHPSQIAHFRMQIFNADGSEPAMCGNGIRCLVDYVTENKNCAGEVCIETKSKVLRCRRDKEDITVDLGVPAILEKDPVFVVDTGVPHAVVFAQDVDTILFPDDAQKIRFDPRFAPEGVNVNFAALLGPNKLRVRTYERGVEAETLSCGTGSAAAAFVARKQHNLKGPILVERANYPSLRFNFLEIENGLHSIEMTGPVQKVFKGTF